MNETFQVVKNKRRRKFKRVLEKTFTGSELIVRYFDVDAASILTKINQARDSFAESPIISELLEKTTLHLKTFNKLICYGLGSVSDSSISRHQLACLLALKDHFEAKASVYDPLFTPYDIEALKFYDVDIIEENDEGKAQISTTGNTILYLPHVPHQLVNNFLWANWKPSLQNCVIIANSFSSVIHLNNQHRCNLNLIRRVIPICEEYLINNNYPLDSAFNDLAVHSFVGCDSVEEEFWDVPAEPHYGDSVEYFVKDLTILMQKL